MTLEPQAYVITYKISVPTAQKTQCLSAIKEVQVKLLGKISMSIFKDVGTENTVCGLKAYFLNFKADRMFSDPCASQEYAISIKYGASVSRLKGLFEKQQRFLTREILALVLETCLATYRFTRVYIPG